MTKATIIALVITWPLSIGMFVLYAFIICAVAIGASGPLEAAWVVPLLIGLFFIVRNQWVFHTRMSVLGAAGQDYRTRNERYTKLPDYPAMVVDITRWRWSVD